MRGLQDILKSVVKFTNEIWTGKPGNWNEVEVSQEMAETLLKDANDLMKRFER